MIKAVVLLSGGMDSAVCLGIAREQYQADEIFCFSMNYGQKHEIEWQAAIKVAAHYRVDLDYVQLPTDMFKSSTSVLTRPDLKMPETTYDELKSSQGVSPTYVPFRNANLLSMATAMCLKFADENQQEWDAIEKPRADQMPPEFIELYYGPHSEDARGWAYPDCTPEFNGAMANAIYIGSYFKVRLITPLQWMTKADIVEKGSSLQVPFHLTYSCYNGREKHCGKCPTCVGRKGAFADSYVPDPTEYEDNNVS